MKTFLVLLLPLCVLGHAGAASAAWLFDAEIGFVHDRNVGLAAVDRDTRADTALEASVSTGQGLSLGDSTMAMVTADVAGVGWYRFRGLSSVSLGLTVASRTKLGLGSLAPWVRLAGSAGRQQHDEDVRDAWWYRLSSTVGKRFGQRWDVRAEYAFEDRRADHARRMTWRLPGNVFDVTSHTGSVRADFLWSERLSLFAGYAVREGDVVSTTRRNAQIFAASSAVTGDPAFGSGWFAYRIDATVHVLDIGLSVALAPRSSLSFGYEHRIGDGARGLGYTNDLARARFLYRY